MTTKSKPQYAAVEQPFGQEQPLVHCPICGQGMLKKEDERYVDINPCEHLAFIFVGEVSDYSYQSSSYEQRMSQIDTEELGLDNFREKLGEAGYENKMLAIEITHGGMACGPVWSTEVYGFDYEQASE